MHLYAIAETGASLSSSWWTLRRFARRSMCFWVSSRFCWSWTVENNRKDLSRPADRIRRPWP